MKTLKNILFIIVITLLTTSCTDTTEDLVINKKDIVENAGGGYFTGEQGDKDETDRD